MEPVRNLWERALRPGEGFRQRAREAPALGASLKELLLLRSPLAFLGMVLGYLSFSSLYARLISPESDLWTRILPQLPETVDPAELRAALANLPAAPGLHALLPWMAALAPVAVLGLWLHDATFDHMALWLLGGLRERRGFRASLVADAEALKVGALGAAAALLAELPGVGFVLGLALLPVAAYFWILRGYALAAWHGCAPWKGVVATLVHVALVGVWLGLLILACVVGVLMLL
ncbi:hypothetical protein [Mesoterricola silvestris]|uniref:Uncharacterized protein n=1 Tax=Mesoterricola silvestris TaxID=2927979 RepID=A0AA48K6P3_9BACT|nr:hypothetical protein [Mesoterricola silvestris]BDU71029.1 hypothetical protein METEAL_02030 [Mesoterricola silvestris]